jgi:hypothetical protein
MSVRNAPVKQAVGNDARIMWSGYRPADGTVLGGAVGGVVVRYVAGGWSGDWADEWADEWD